jgi:hypothetical protein
MNKNAITYIVVFVTVLAFIAWYLDRERWKNRANKAAQERDQANRKNMRLFAENQIIRQQMLQMYDDIVELREALAKGDAIESSMLKKLSELINIYKDIDAKVSGELASTMKLLEADEPIKATFTLAKVVENLLKDKFQNDSEFHRFIEGRMPRFADYLNYAERTGLIGKEERSFAMGLKEIRNQEGHELDVKKDKGIAQTAILFGIGMITKLCYA